MLEQLYQIRKEILHNQFSTMGRPYLDGFHMTILPPPPFYDEEPIEFEVTSAAVLILITFEGEQWIVLTRQADREGNPWELPSGGVNPEDKTPEDTARREVLEETGMILNEITPLTYARKPNTNKGGLQYYAEITVDELDIISRDDEHIYLRVPDIVDNSEISEICLESYNLQGKSFLNTSGHPWAYRRTIGALEQKLEG